jgi:hypothetical protein
MSSMGRETRCVSGAAVPAPPTWRRAALEPTVVPAHHALHVVPTAMPSLRRASAPTRRRMTLSGTDGLDIARARFGGDDLGDDFGDDAPARARARQTTIPANVVVLAGVRARRAAARSQRPPPGAA